MNEQYQKDYDITHIKVIQAQTIKYMNDNKENILAFKTTHKIVYLWLFYEFTRLHQYNNKISLTVGRIADNTGLSTRTISRVLVDLKQANIVYSYSEKEDGINKPTIYTNVIDIVNSNKHKLVYSSKLYKDRSKVDKITLKQWDNYRKNKEKELERGYYFDSDLDMFESVLFKQVNFKRETPID